jgi:alpha-tubulin suppressor-like RCC1 family protein
MTSSDIIKIYTMKKIITLLFTVFLFNFFSFGQCFSTLSCGEGHVTAKKTDGSLWVWGWGNWGQLNNTTNLNAPNPLQLTTGTNWLSVAAGQYNTLAIKSNGTLWGCGGNTTGQLGLGNTNAAFNLVQIGTANNWKQVAPGSFFTIALKTDNTLWAWGQNDGSQMGNNTCCADQLTPIQIGTATDWKTIGTSGSRSGFAIKNNGTLWCWGTNLSGLIGDSFVTEFTVPTQHNPDTNWDKMSVGYDHILVLKTSGSLWAWGGGGNGETGHDPSSSYDPSVPFQIAGTWKTMATGLRFSMGIKTDGTLWAWGRNDVGQLGNGSTGLVNYVPIQLGTATNWESVACGFFHTVALRTDGSLWSWGKNNYGQLGNGTLTTVPTPTYVPIAGCTLGTETFASETNAMQLSPNPSNNDITIDYKGKENVDAIVIYDVLGKVVFTIEALGNNAFSSSFSIAGLASGTYVVALKNGKGNVVSKTLVKE